MAIFYHLLGALSGLFHFLRQFRRGRVPALAYLILPAVLIFYILSLLLQNQTAIGDPDHPRETTLQEIKSGKVDTNTIVRVKGILSADTGIRTDCKDTHVYPVLQSAAKDAGVLVKIYPKRPLVPGTAGTITGVLRRLPTGFGSEVRLLQEDGVSVSPQYLLVHGAAAMSIKRLYETLNMVRIALAGFLGFIALSLVWSGPVFLRGGTRPRFGSVQPFAAYEQPELLASGVFQPDFSLSGRRTVTPVYTTDAFTSDKHCFVGAIPAVSETQGGGGFFPMGLMFGLMGWLISLSIVPFFQALFFRDRMTESGRIFFGQRDQSDLTWGTAYFGWKAYPALRVRYEQQGASRSVTFLTDTEENRERLAATLLTEPERHSGEAPPGLF
jgi:hypothetical protein